MMIRNTFMAALFGMLLATTACAGEVAPQEEVGASADELISAGSLSGKPSCPGGASPRCVSCGSGAKCYTACTGDYTCDIEEENNPDGSGSRQCSSSLTACKSYAPSPSFGSIGAIAW